MGKLYLTFGLFAILTFGAHAQQCFIDSAVNITPIPGTLAIFTPSSDSLACMVRGQQVSDTLYFTMFTTLNGFVIDSVTIDSVNNLPAGICWATNSADNTFGAGQNGVLYLSGLTYVPSGQYKLRIFINASTNVFSIPVANLETATGIRYYVRLRCPGDACPPIDTAGGRDSLFIPYTSQVCGVGINEINNALSGLSIAPDPFTVRTQISFHSNIEGSFTVRMLDILGAVVSTREIEVAPGSNYFSIERNGLSPGVYMLSISGSASSVNKKVIIE